MDLNLVPLAARFESHNGIQYARIARTECERVRREAKAFGIFDAKGREIGHMFTIDREFHVIDADSRMLCEINELDDNLEETFRVKPHGSRDGAAFGPLPTASYKRFKTLAEAEVYAHQTIARAEARALKKAR
jgi:hypothetical protein